ncbi:MAG: hypothetical protein WC905_01170 [Patescibacteria group bacterium]|jgi:hypothetical protein
MKISKIIPILMLAGMVFLAPRLLQAQEIDPNFNPNLILSDSDIMSYDMMSLQDIQNFLQNKGSYLANYSAVNTHGVVKSAAEIIYDATHKNYDCDGVTLSDTPTEAEKMSKCRCITTVNPRFILVLLQKEASLIEDSSPAQSRLDWATGYGCPDSWVCNPYYKGFGKQVNSAALQFLAYMNEPNRYTYKAGQTYTFTNPYGTISKEPIIVTPQNRATAALYNYTPHVYNGNYNVYKLWNRYFPKVSRYYPDGSIIKASDNPKVWLIENGKKRPFANWSAYVSRFKPEQIIAVNASDLENYPAGSEIKFANYSLIQTPDKKIYLLVDKEKRPFADLATFKKFGFNPEELETATIDDLSGYQVGKTITATSTYITGALIQDSVTGEIFYVEDGKKSLVDKVLLKVKFVDKKIIKKTTKELKAYATSSPILFDEGTLTKTDTFPTVYLISGGKKRPFADDATFQKLGYNPANIIPASSQFLYNYDMGEKIQ